MKRYENGKSNRKLFASEIVLQNNVCDPLLLVAAKIEPDEKVMAREEPKE